MSPTPPKLSPPNLAPFNAPLRVSPRICPLSPPCTRSVRDAWVAPRALRAWHSYSPSSSSEASRNSKRSALGEGDTRRLCRGVSPPPGGLEATGCPPRSRVSRAGGWLSTAHSRMVAAPWLLSTKDCSRRFLGGSAGRGWGGEERGEWDNDGFTGNRNGGNRNGGNWNGGIMMMGKRPEVVKCGCPRTCQGWWKSTTALPRWKIPNLQTSPGTA